MKQTLTVLVAAAGIVSVAGPLLAHHGAATFDTGKEVVLEGTVVEWVWSNPHCFLKFDVKERDGSVRTWVTETSEPAVVVNRGWSRGSFRAGVGIKATV